MTLKLDMQHLGLVPYQVSSNDDPWLIIIQQGQIWSLRLIYGKKANSEFFWFCCSSWHQSWFMQSAKWTFITIKVIKGQGHLETFVLGVSDSVFSFFFFSNNISSKTTMPLRPNSKIFWEPNGQWPWNLVGSVDGDFKCSTGSPMQPYQVCSNDDPWLTLSYLIARSNLVS